MESSSAGVQFQPRNRDGGTFAEVGMIAQVSAIQLVMDKPCTHLTTRLCFQITYKIC